MMEILEWQGRDWNQNDNSAESEEQNKIRNQQERSQDQTQNTSKQNTSKQNTSKQNTSKQNTLKQNASEQNTSKQNTSKQNASKQNTSKQNPPKQDSQERKTEKEIEQKEDEKLEEYGQMTLEQNQGKKKIHLLSIIGEVEGHENLSGNTKATKYDHVLPQLAALEDDDSIKGLLVLLNTSGGDVDAGLAIAEMIASLSMPTVSLVLGGSHSIGVPLAVCTDYSFIVPTGTMMIHPVRMSGLVIGASQTYEYFEMIQDRILSFISTHAKSAYDQVKNLMLNTEMLTRDLGTVLVGKETVEHGLIDEVGGIKEALRKIYQMVEEREQEEQEEQDR